MTKAVTGGLKIAEFCISNTIDIRKLRFKLLQFVGLYHIKHYASNSLHR